MGGCQNYGPFYIGLYWGYMGDNGKENGNYYNGLYGWLLKLCRLSGSLLGYGT